MAVNIRHHVATINQPNMNDCWAAATAMVMHRHSNAGTEHVKSLARAARVPLDNGTMPDESVRLLAKAVGLRFHDFTVKELTLRELGTLLGRGPIVAFGFFNIPSLRQSIKHAVTIFSLVGDGSDRGTTLKLIDPGATINPFSDDWDDFNTRVADITFVLSY
jgi:hypothetical protein